MYITKATIEKNTITGGVLGTANSAFELGNAKEVVFNENKI